GVRPMACGAWRVACGVWRVACGAWPVARAARPVARWAPRPPQIPAVSATTDLVTIGIGGNSIGFTDIVTNCVEQGIAAFGLGSPCSTYYTRGRGAPALDRGFASLEADFTATLNAIRTRAPRAKVAVVGYRAVVDDNTGCSWGTWHQLGTVTKGDMPWLDTLERRLNTARGIPGSRAPSAKPPTPPPAPTPSSAPATGASANAEATPKPSSPSPARSSSSPGT
ncbi:hypothetical protein J7E98_34370, partial [Streptomyces sp. ISL-86]|nr:hypothetical protein [Streptomyces sp. ISL-86]